jgi:RNA polymerase sigma-70 factor (ECF subfamily)
MGAIERVACKETGWAASNVGITVSPREQNEHFESWLSTHGAMLHHVVNGFAEGADRDDLMQELLLAVWRAVPAFRHGAQPSTFIYRVAHNAALTWRRTRENYRRRIDRFETLSAVESPLGPESSTRERETLELLYTHIRALPPIERSLILLHLDGVGYAQIAEIHGLTETNVGVKLSRLKNKLSDAMKEFSHELR